MTKWIAFRYGGQDFVVPESKLTDLRVQKLLKQGDIISLKQKPTIQTIRKPQKKVKKTMPFLRRRIRKVIERKRLTGVEIENIKRIADKHGIARDLFDWKAHIDRTLSYRENVTQITSKIGSISTPRSEVAVRNIKGNVEKRINELNFAISCEENGEKKRELKHLMEMVR